MDIVTHLDRIERYLTNEHARMLLKNAQNHAHYMVQEHGGRAEIWCSWHPSDLVGSMKVHVVTDETRALFCDVLTNGRRDASLLEEVIG